MSVPPPIVFRSMSFERAAAPAPGPTAARPLVGRILGRAVMALRG
jgi:hypothetical protein